jgi:uncharacterized protein YndB with AHSA1/START domain
MTAETDMNERSTKYATYTIERNFDDPPAQVFAAWANPATKARWFSGPRGKWKEKIREFNFRVGGRERLIGTWTGGAVSTFDARYLDIVADRRIVYSYDMHLDERKISISLATVEFIPAGAGTRMTFTEQAVFLDGYNDADGRKQGTRALLDQLKAALSAKPAARRGSAEISR